MTQVLKVQWDGFAGLAAAMLLTILSVLGILPSDQVPTATLGVLALACFVMIRANVDREATTRAVETFETKFAESDDQVTKLITESNHRLLASLEALSTIQVQRAAGLQGVTHQAIGPAFINVLKKTHFWIFKGGTGSYLRAETLPRLALSPLPSTRKVWIEIIDPCNPRVRQTYADYQRQIRRSHGGHDSEGWSPERVMIESCATIVAALWYTANHNIQARLALSSVVSSFRYDMCAEFVMITNEEWDSTALRANRDCNFYERYNEDLKLSFEQAREIDLTRSTIGERISRTDVRRVLAELPGVDLEDSMLTNTVCNRIAAKAISAAHATALGQQQGAAQNPYT